MNSEKHNRVLDIINRLKYPIVFLATQLFIQGQWWSKTDIHLLQTQQCFDQAGLIILQVVHF
jgi:hypothetical protein